MSFGQGVSASSVQLITALSAIANGGFMLKPYIVKAVKEPNGTVVRQTNPTIVRKVISEDTAREVTRMLVEVTVDGTGVNAAIDDFDVAGKTGTAQKPDLVKGGYMKGAYLASFMGFVPANDPRLAILVTVDEPQGDYYGGNVAAPAFKEIASQGLSYLGVFPHNPASPRVVQAKALSPAASGRQNGDRERFRNAVPDFSGKTMRAVLKMAAERSLDVDVIGSGLAVSQKPAPGSSLSSSVAAQVTFR